MNLNYGSWIAAGLLTCGHIMAADSPAQSAHSANETNDCTWFNTISDWKRLDDSNLLVWASQQDVFHVQLSMPLFGLTSSDSIAFIDHNRDGRLCGFGMDQVVVPHSPITSSSTIFGITRLDDAQLVKLADQYKVKVKLASRKKAQDGETSPR